MIASTSKISNPNSPLLAAQKQLMPAATAGSTVFTYKLFIPIFTPADPLTLSLTYSNTFPLHTGMTCTEFKIKASISATLSLVISANFDVLPAGQTTPVTFRFEGNFVLGQSLVLSGMLTSPWNDVFGQKWMSIPHASATLDLGASSKALSIYAQCVMTFGTSASTVQVILQSGNDFTQYCFSASLAKQW